MTHHQFGAIVGDVDTGGIFSLADAVLVHAQTSVAVETIQEGAQLPVIAIELVGRINKTQDTFQGVFLLSVMDAGQLAGVLHNAAARVGTAEALSDFGAGYKVGLT